MSGLTGSRRVVLNALRAQPGRIFAPGELGTAQAVKVYICELRKHHLLPHERIENVRGEGYVLRYVSAPPAGAPPLAPPLPVTGRPPLPQPSRRALPPPAWEQGSPRYIPTRAPSHGRFQEKTKAELLAELRRAVENTR